MTTQVVREASDILKEMGLLDPIGEVETQWREGRAFQDLTGTTIGFLDNTFAGADHLLTLVEERFKREYDLRDTVKLRKFIYSRRATPEQIQDLASACDLVVTGVGG